jgi:hypothetical protein
VELLASGKQPAIKHRIAMNSSYLPAAGQPPILSSNVLASNMTVPLPEVDSAVLQWVMSLLGEDDDDGENLKRWSSFIGIIVAISGNVLISLALNIQKYAHIRLRREKAQRRLMVRRRRKEQAWSRALALNGAAGQHRRTQEELGAEDIDGIGQLDGDETPEDQGEKYGRNRKRRRRTTICTSILHGGGWAWC